MIKKRSNIRPKAPTFETGSELPTTDQAVQVIRELMSQPDYTTADGKSWVRMTRARFAIVPQNSSLWRMPEGQPHGHHYSPAYSFIEHDLLYSGKVETLRMSGGYIRAKEAAK